MNICHPFLFIDDVIFKQKNTHTVRKEGSSAKPKSTSLMLEKAIRDLEKIVAESKFENNQF